MTDMVRERSMGSFLNNGSESRVRLRWSRALWLFLCLCHLIWI